MIVICGEIPKEPILTSIIKPEAWIKVYDGNFFEVYLQNKGLEFLGVISGEFAKFSKFNIFVMPIFFETVAIKSNTKGERYYEY